MTPTLKTLSESGRLVMSGIPIDNDSIIAAGPTIKPSGIASRIVLRIAISGFVVHEQIFPKYVDGKSAKDFEGSSFNCGGYFPPSGLHEAMDEFARRTVAHAKWFDATIQAAA